MKLSILLPTHNRADVIPFAIESVLAQTMGDFELLVCGDGCTDDTAQIVARYMAADPRIRWFDLPKAPGIGYANRNTVLREARGEFVGFMAHDDLVTADHFSSLVGALQDPAVHLAYSGSCWVSREGRIIPTVFTLEDRFARLEFAERRWNRIPAPCFMHRRSAFAAVGGWNEELLHGGDLDLWSRIISAWGDSAVASTSLMSCFHFRAPWHGDDLAPDTEPIWQQLHQAPGRLPALMHWHVPPGMTEQEAFWLRLRTEAGVVEPLRHACLHALITCAWQLEAHLTAQRGVPPVMDYEGILQKLRGKVEALKARSITRDANLRRLKKERDRFKKELAEATRRPSWWRRLPLPWRTGQEKPALLPAMPPPAAGVSPSMTDEQIKEFLPKYSFYHFIPLRQGLCTPGNPAHEPSQQPFRDLISHTDLKGKRVLDIGCRDGLYSFQAEKQGAAEVIGIDNDLSRGAVEFLIPFFQSKVRMYQMNLLDLRPDTLGRFDVILFSGVLYHLRHPFHALRLLHRLMEPGGTLLIETAIFHGQADRAMLYCPVGEDSPYKGTSCTFFNKKGLMDSLESLGFRTLSWSCLHPEAETAHVAGTEPVIDRAVLRCEHAGEPRNKEIDGYWHGTHSILSDFGADARHSGVLKWKKL